MGSAQGLHKVFARHALDFKMSVRDDLKYAASGIEPAISGSGRRRLIH